MANKTSIHRSVFQSLLGTGPMHQCTDWKGNRMAGMHELRNVAVTLPVKLRGFSGFDCLSSLKLRAKAPENRPKLPPKGDEKVFQPFSGAMLVWGSLLVWVP